MELDTNDFRVMGAVKKGIQKEKIKDELNLQIKGLEIELLEAVEIGNHIEVDSMQRSSDGTLKNAVRLHDGLIVESVLIPTAKRTTACVSSQVGCSLDCKF